MHPWNALHFNLIYLFNALNLMWPNLELTEHKVTKWIHKFKLQSAIIYIRRIVHTVGATTKIYAFGEKWPFCDLTCDQSRWSALIMIIMFLRYPLHQCERLRRASSERKIFEYFRQIGLGNLHYKLSVTVQSLKSTDSLYRENHYHQHHQQLVYCTQM